MTIFNPNLILPFVAALIPLVIVGLAVHWDRHSRQLNEKSPQSEKLLRPPGHSLSLRLDKTIDKFLDYIMVAALCAAFGGGAASIFALALGEKAPFIWLAGLFSVAALFIGLCAWFSLRAFHCADKARGIRLGLRGEQAVAEALGETADCGFRAFHDFPAEDHWNIDHVVVGSRGVFLIETKARRRHRISRKSKQKAHEVIFDGSSLQFPYGKTDRPINQARGNAQWLAKYLTKRTGEPVAVEPLVVLPGWFVSNTQKGDFPVKAMNAVYLVEYLRGQTETIGPAQVRRIIAALDEKCRDVEF
ncbi:MAG: nuclease-related domain-containing protein [Verrucomicrobiota bacterium]